MTDPFEHFVTPMLRHFADPPGTNPKGFFDDLCADLADEVPGSTPYQFAEAVKTLRRARRSRTFPTIAECIAAVKEQPFAPPEALPVRSRDPAPKDDPWSPESEQFADRLLRGTEIAKEALEAKWLYALWDFCRAHKRLPEGREIKACKDRGAHAQRRIRECREAALKPAEKPMTPIPGFTTLGANFDFRGSQIQVAEVYEAAERNAVRRVFPRMPLSEAAE